METIVEYLTSIPVPCLIGLCYAGAILLLPIAQWLKYRHDVKKYGKDIADEIARRY